MNDKLYDLMDWGKIEALVYSEEDHPMGFLGPCAVDGSVLIQTFLPGAQSADVVLDETGKRCAMEMADESGFFAVLLPLRTIPAYHFEVTFKGEDEKVRVEDPYRFSTTYTDQDFLRFCRGIDYEIYQKLGAHSTVVDGTEGVRFCVWAPNALRVSLVGDFNHWDGRACPMERIGGCGVFELFVPRMKPGTLYKYEIKAKGGLTFLKADPYAFYAEKAPGTASIVADIGGYEWHDEKWLKERGGKNVAKSPVAVLEIHPGTFRREGEEASYREMAKTVPEYALEMGYTHVELMPVMEFPQDETQGYQTSGYYAPTSRYGTPADFMYFVDEMHRRGLGVILDWAPNQFAPDLFGLRGFDGTDLYEHHDPRKGRDPRWGSFLYNYGRPEVSNFLIGAALFWTRVYHADGLRMNDVASMLYLNYGREDGQWVANMYGGNENLEAVEFIKHLNSIMKKEDAGVLLIAQESGAWPMVTEPVENNGLGFDLKWNNGWISDFLSYMQLDPIFRGPHHHELTLSMIYNYSEQFILPFAHDEAGVKTGSMLSRMSGRKSLKFANLRAAFGYLITHPGKKMIFMGQDFGQEEAWDVDRHLHFEEMDEPLHQGLRRCVADLLALYKEYPALYELDFDSAGFTWINEISANENMLVFLRNGEKEDDKLMVVCNFSPLVYDNHKIGVPFHGKYKEIFNSDKEIYGGEGNLNPRLKVSKADECDGFEESIRIKVPPMGISILTCTKTAPPISENVKAAAKRKAMARTAGTGKKAGEAKKRTESLKDELARKVQEAEEA